MFFDVCFLLKYIFLFWHCLALNVFSIWKTTMIRLYMSCVWKQFQDEMLHQKKIAKDPLDFFWFKAGDFNISDIFYKIKKNLNKGLVFLATTHWTYMCLSPLEELIRVNRTRYPQNIAKINLSVSQYIAGVVATLALSRPMFDWKKLYLKIVTLNHGY